MAEISHVKVDNLICPVHPDEATPETVPSDLVVERRGRKLGLCREECLDEWARWSDGRKDGFLDLIAGAQDR